MNKSGLDDASEEAGSSDDFSAFVAQITNVSVVSGHGLEVAKERIGKHKDRIGELLALAETKGADESLAATLKEACSLLQTACDCIHTWTMVTSVLENSASKATSLHQNTLKTIQNRNTS